MSKKRNFKALRKVSKLAQDRNGGFPRSGRPVLDSIFENQEPYLPIAQFYRERGADLEYLKEVLVFNFVLSEGKSAEQAKLYERAIEDFLGVFRDCNQVITNEIEKGLREAEEARQAALLASTGGKKVLY